MDPLRIAGIGLNVADVERASSFYTALGFSPVGLGTGWRSATSILDLTVATGAPYPDIRARRTTRGSSTSPSPSPTSSTAAEIALAARGRRPSRAVGRSSCRPTPAASPRGNSATPTAIRSNCR